ncbi:hypothetical protein BJ508DRAFT_28285 [Ascobolus immersus RN42]|uniref:HTH APSES-type domain-containing protein n=1 Tax=Ascobolus immersus RN42 TaxID=1160509 RepID=A0A3N4HNQ8_ASCIM|nr:hypothetical protein BJ508DRAFT_28285 [Ascobolus immersus RN42]
MARTAKTPKSNPNTYEAVPASDASPRNTRRSTRASSKATNTSASAHSRQNSESLRSTPVPNKMVRSLPERFNPRLADDVPSYDTLVKTRKNGVTNLGLKGGDGGLFSYVHLKAPLPKGLVSEIFTPPVPECYFLMKRASDNFVSATGMFKAAFPWAKRAEEEEERRHIRATYPNTSKEETAGNLWVHPDDAQILAEEYGMYVWIKALLDPVPVGAGSGKRTVPSTPAQAATEYSTPRAPQTPEESGSPAPSEKPIRRSARSVSPSKSVASPRKRAMKTPKSRINKDLEIPDLAPPKSSKLSKVEQVAEVEEKVETTTNEKIVETKTETENDSKIEQTKTEETTTEETTKTTLSDVVVPPTPTQSSRRKSAVKVEAETREETDGDVIVKETNVKVALPAGVELPESTEDMIAKAKEMVEAAKAIDGDARVAKRKAEDIAMGDAESDDEDLDEEAKRAKRTKVQNQLRREKVKTRALIGLSATLVVGALLPYFGM